MSKQLPSPRNGISNSESERSVLPDLFCPACRGTLQSGVSYHQCANIACAKRFPIVDGLSILIDDESSVFSITDYEVGLLSKPHQSSVQRMALRYLPSLDINVAARRNVDLLSAELFSRSEHPRILNIGGKHPQAALASLRHHADIHCTECDVVPGPGISIIADPRRLPFGDSSFDAVIADAILEHSVAPQEVVDEIHRVLRPRGLVYADTPFMLPVHGGAYDFNRFSALAHRRLFAGYTQISAGVSAGPGAALGNAVQSAMLAFVTRRWARFAVKGLCRIGFFWIKYIDYIVAHRPGALDGAQGTFFIGERSDIPLSDTELLAAYRGGTPDLYLREQPGHT